MSTKAIIIIAALAVIAIAVLFSGKVRAKLGSFMLNADKQGKNRLDLDGEENKVIQGKATKDSSVSNEAKVRGKQNEVDQG